MKSVSHLLPLILVSCIAWLSNPTPSSAQQTITCPPGQYDMLDWLTLDSDLRGSNYFTNTNSPLYTVVYTSGSTKFYWLKGGSGFPWDINLYDNNYIYRWVTENVWGDPTTYKKAYTDTNKPFVARCAAAGSPGWNQVIPPSGSPFNTKYAVYDHPANTNGCHLKEVDDLNYVVNEVWGPYSESFGGNIPNPITTLVVSYRWGCTNNGNGTYSCTNKEEYHLAQRYGLVQWKHFTSSNCDPNTGKCTWTVQDTSTHSNLVSGVPPAPNVPCLN
jgi:hypothetical protein